jgi:hypothetical protein
MKEETLKMIEDLIEVYVDTPLEVYWIFDFIRGARVALTNHAILQSEGLSRNEWISVWDRLPKVDGEYLIWDNGCYAAGFYKGTWKSFEKCVSGVLSDFRATLLPTHWMPLPTPPNQNI